MPQTNFWTLSTTQRTDISIPGSPERCIKRSVVEDETGALWVLEHIAPEQVDRRETISRNLQALLEAGFSRQAAYQKTATGQFVATENGRLLQLSPYLSGAPLPQPDYVDDPERGLSLARLLAALQAAAQGLELEDARPGLALPPYIAALHRTIAARRPEVGARLAPTLDALDPLVEAYADLETAFNHGDFHPLNVIWRGTKAHALIDWEFCGYRPRLFDAANLLGCVGIEDPQALTRGLAPAFLRGLLEAGLATGADMALLPSLLLAQRWAWLSEWLRQNDREMLDLELDYMELLTANLDALSRAWNAL